MKFIKILLIYIFLLFVITLSTNKLFSNEFTAQLDSTEILIGSRAVLTLQTPLLDGKIIYPNLIDSLNGLKIISISQIDTINLKNKQYLSQKLYLTSFDSGIYNIMPLVFVYIDNNQLTKVYNTSALTLKVNSIDISQMKDINAIKGFLNEDKNLMDYFPFILAFFGLIVLIFIMFKIWKNKKRKPKIIEEKHKEIIIDPKKWLFDELISLKERELYKKSEIKLHYSLLSEAFRRYLELKYDIPALENTTEEIKFSLQNKMDSVVINDLIFLLNQSDLVKFAKFIPSEIDAENQLNAAFNIYEKI